MVRRISLPLCVKVESLVAVLIHNLLDTNQNDLFGDPTTNIFSQEYSPSFSIIKKLSDEKNSTRNYEKEGAEIISNPKRTSLGRGEILREKLLRAAGVVITANKIIGNI